MEKCKSEGMKSKVVGKERDRLKSLLWPTLTPKQHAQYKTPTSPRFNSWITETIAAVIKKVRFPEHTAKCFKKCKRGKANSFTKEAIKQKNQLEHIRKGKDKHKKAHPFCTHKYHGTIAKKKSQKMVEKIDTRLVW